MRVTNSMINRNNIYNINNNKFSVDKMFSQMSSQKKIQNASDDPVIAIRALRLRTTLSEINQYYEKNIPDAESWLEVTECAINNIKNLLKDAKTKCEYGANNTLNQENRKALLDELKQMKNQIYSEMNTDEAGRTVFSGYKTNKTVSLTKDDKDMDYTITEKLSYQDIGEKKYYANLMDVSDNIPDGNGGLNPAPTADQMLQEKTCNRLRLSYGQMENGNNSLDSFSYSYKEGNEEYRISYKKEANGDFKKIEEKKKADGKYETLSEENPTTKVAERSYEQWQKDGFELKQNEEVVYIKETGELIFSEDARKELYSKKADLQVTYDKKGFEKGDVRPEMYFDCTDKNAGLSYEKQRQDIEYTVAFNQTLTVNTQPEDVVDAGVGRDIEDLEEAVQLSIDAHDKYDKIKDMMGQERYSSKENQEKLQGWLEAAKKECDYADENMKNVFSKNIGIFDDHFKKATLAQTEIGAKGDSLDLTKNRMLGQQETYKELKSKNEDRDISDVILDYTSAYFAYQASLQAAGKANQTSLLNYI